VLLTIVFRCGKVYYSNSIIITNFVWTLVPDCRFENVFPAYFRIELSNKISMRISVTDQIHVLLRHRSCPSHHRSYRQMGRARTKQ
jgi:hypothetical protein